MLNTDQYVTLISRNVYITYYGHFINRLSFKSSKQSYDIGTALDRLRYFSQQLAKTGMSIIPIFTDVEREAYVNGFRIPSTFDFTPALILYTYKCWRS